MVIDCSGEEVGGEPDGKLIVETVLIAEYRLFVLTSIFVP